MSFMNSMKKKAGELASMVMEDGTGGEPMRQELDRIERSLQAQIKELKGFVNGMNSMCGAALAAGGASFQSLDDKGRSVYAVALAHGHGWLFRKLETIDAARGLRPDGSRRPAADLGSAGSMGSSRSSYLDGPKSRRKKAMETMATGDSKFGRLQDKAKMPAAWATHKWPWQREKGF